jgi:hypothetical protein
VFFYNRNVFFYTQPLCFRKDTDIAPLLSTAEPFALFHYRRTIQAEVDCVAVLESGGIVGIEVKATRDIRADHLKGLRALKKSVGAAWKGGVVLYTGQNGMGFGDDIGALPVSALWEHGQRQTRTESPGFFR